MRRRWRDRPGWASRPPSGSSSTCEGRSGGSPASLPAVGHFRRTTMPTRPLSLSATRRPRRQRRYKEYLRGRGPPRKNGSERPYGPLGGRGSQRGDENGGGLAGEHGICDHGGGRPPVKGEGVVEFLRSEDRRGLVE